MPPLIAILFPSFLRPLDLTHEADLVPVGRVLRLRIVDAVVVDVTVQPVDSMEKLYMTVNVNA